MFNIRKKTLKTQNTWSATVSQTIHAGSGGAGGAAQSPNYYPDLQIGQYILTNRTPRLEYKDDLKNDKNDVIRQTPPPSKFSDWCISRVFDIKRSQTVTIDQYTTNEGITNIDLDTYTAEYSKNVILTVLDDLDEVNRVIPILVGATMADNLKDLMTTTYAAIYKFLKTKDFLEAENIAHEQKAFLESIKNIQDEFAVKIKMLMPD